MADRIGTPARFHRDHRQGQRRGHLGADRGHQDVRAVVPGDGQQRVQPGGRDPLPAGRVRQPLQRGIQPLRARIRQLVRDTLPEPLVARQRGGGRGVSGTLLSGFRGFARGRQGLCDLDVDPLARRRPGRLHPLEGEILIGLHLCLGRGRKRQQPAKTQGDQHKPAAQGQGGPHRRPDRTRRGGAGPGIGIRSHEMPALLRFCFPEVSQNPRHLGSLARICG